MYTVNIPINCDKFYRARDKQAILDELRAFDADRVMLNFETALDGHILLYNEDAYRRQLDRMREACAFFKGHGYEVGAWFWGLQFGEGFPFTEIRTLNGKTVKNFACPSDTDFREAFARCLTDVAETGVDIILLNDDLRFGAWGGFGCICKNHLKMICEELGEELDEERLKELILNGGKNKYRDAFLRANKRSFEDYARRMRAAVDTVKPDIRLGFCACMTSWDIDGDAFDLARIFAGNTKPLIRLIGAPYWANFKTEMRRLHVMIEMNRLEASWNPYDDIEVISEGDVYPRPRLNCAANFLEGFDTALRASGALDGILRICMDYVSNVGYETGYLKHYLKNKPIYRKIDEHFSDKKHTGIRIYESKCKVATMEMPNALGTASDMEEVFYSVAARVLTSSAIPTVYEGTGVTGIVFGENAYAIDEACFERGMIIDALAAKILSERGFDVGIERFGANTPIKFQYINEDENYIIARKASAVDVTLKPGAEILSLGSQDLENPSIPFCYRYENAAGQKFLVFNCNAQTCEMVLRHPANAKLIEDSIEWLSGERLPAFCHGHPNLYMQCKENESGTAIGLWNFFEDEVIDPIVQLGREYESAEFINCTGSLLGDKISLSDIAPYGFCGVVLKK